jgi:vacuolar protein sorting-associated protein 13A/C
MKYSLIVCEL